MLRWTSIIRALAALAGAAAFATSALAADNICFVYVSPVGDAGWTYQHDLGRKEMEKALAGKVTTKFVENVAEGADAERVIRELAQSGCKVVFATSFGYMNYMEKVSKQFPKVIFMHATGYKTGPNFGIYNARFYEGRYLTGVIAGKMTKSNVLGYVAAFPIPEVLQGINAFAKGARSVNPKAEVRVIWVELVVRPRQGARGRQHADLAGRRRRHPPHRLDRRRAGRRGEGQVCVRLSLRHVEVRAEGASDRDDARLGRFLHEDRRTTRSAGRGRRPTSGAA